MNDLGLCLEVV